MKHTPSTSPGAKPISWQTHGWNLYFTQMHEYERDGAAFRANAQIVNAGSFTGWIYHHTTTGPGGQAVVESTEIDIAHMPEP